MFPWFHTKVLALGNVNIESDDKQAMGLGHASFWFWIYGLCNNKKQNEALCLWKMNWILLIAVASQFLRWHAKASASGWMMRSCHWLWFYYSVMVSEKVPLLFWVCSSLLRMNWLVSINRSTQFTKHTSVLESSFGPGLSMHFSCKEKHTVSSKQTQNWLPRCILWYSALLTSN